MCRLHIDHEKASTTDPNAATAEPDYINLAVLRKRLMSQPAGLARFPNVIGYASTQRILELYGNPHTPLLPDSGKDRGAELIGSLKLGNVWFYLQLILRPTRTTNKLY